MPYKIEFVLYFGISELHTEGKKLELCTLVNRSNRKYT